MTQGFFFDAINRAARNLADCLFHEAGVNPATGQIEGKSLTEWEDEFLSQLQQDGQEGDWQRVPQT